MSAFWPFAVFSPEWQAIRWAVTHDLPVRFFDLPYGYRLSGSRAPTPGRTTPPPAEGGEAAAPDDPGGVAAPPGEGGEVAGPAREDGGEPGGIE